MPAITPVVKEFRHNQCIVRQGDYSNGVFYFLQNGTARVEVNGQPVGEIHPGEFFGELAAILQGRRTATVIAQTACSVVEFQGLNDGALYAMMAVQPKAAKKILETLARRIVELNDRLEEALRQRPQFD